MAVNIPVTSKPRIVIIGAGFAGIELAKALATMDAQVVLIDKNNHHTFQPLLYQVATAGLEPVSIAYPVREIFRGQKNFIFRMADVLELRPEACCVVTSIGEIPYDHLVLATGARTNYFGMSDVEKFALPMKTLRDAVDIRNTILEDLENAVLTTSLEERDSLMTFVIIGGGPTGVELAGALVELKAMVLPHDHPELDLKKMQVHLVDMEDRLLKGMSPDSSRSAQAFLTAHDVNVWLGAKVLSFDGSKVALSNGKIISTKNVIWAAGVAGALIPGLTKDSLVGARVKVDHFNRAPGLKNVYALGDVACMVSEKIPRGHPMVAPVAIQQAQLLARNLGQIIHGSDQLTPFSYKDLGVLATVGRHHAVAELFFGKFRGFPAWIMWAALHLMTLVGFRNKMVAMINWTWSYFRYDSGLRIIFRQKQAT